MSKLSTHHEVDVVEAELRHCERAGRRAAGW